MVLLLGSIDAENARSVTTFMFAAGHSYKDVVQRLAAQCGASIYRGPKEVIEDYLWHGCPAVAVKPITRNGLNERLADGTCLYGTGLQSQSFRNTPMYR